MKSFKAECRSIAERGSYGRRLIIPDENRCPRAIAQKGESRPGRSGASPIVSRATRRIVGFIETERGRFFVREWIDSPITIRLGTAANFDPSGDDLSELRILQGARKVLVIRWSAAGAFKVVVFERGEWEVSVRR